MAQKAGLSRSAFAARFQEVVGQTPLKYLTVWRLDLSADHLRAGQCDDRRNSGACWLWLGIRFDPSL
jgi:methylphosphotriester-DNA--protein-cysteine methyltransferase